VKRYHALEALVALRLEYMLAPPTQSSQCEESEGQLEDMADAHLAVLVVWFPALHCAGTHTGVCTSVVFSEICVVVDA